MTSNAITSQAAHATLEDLGYKTCKKRGTDHRGYKWLGEIPCPKCKPAGEKRHPKPRPESKPPPKKERKKGICGHPLSTGNPGPLCRPCVVTWRREHPNLEIPRTKNQLLNPKDDSERRKDRYHKRKRNGSVKGDERVALPSLWVFLNKASINGIGREVIAERAGVSLNTLYGWSIGRHPCPPGKAEKLAETLGTTVEILKGPPDEPSVRQYHLYARLRNLNAIRQREGLTWPQLAEKAGVSVSSLKHYGQIKATRCLPKTAQQIADALGVSLDELKGEG